MDKQQVHFVSINAYIAIFPEVIRTKLEELRATIKAAAPGAEEKIGLRMPTFVLKGYLVHFAAYKNHVGFYPTPSGMQAFQQELSIYKRSKGAVQFSVGQPIPLDLVAEDDHN